MLSIAYPGAMKYYYKTIRELPAGWGFADVIFIPKKASASLPALVTKNAVFVRFVAFHIRLKIKK